MMINWHLAWLMMLIMLMMVNDGDIHDQLVVNHLGEG